MLRSKISKLVASVAGSVLLLGSLTAIAPAASAAVTQGCISSGFQPQNCQSQKTPIADIYEAINTQNVATSPSIPNTCLSPTHTLNEVITSGNGSMTGVTGPIAGLVWDSTTATLSGTTQGTAFATKNYIILTTCQGGAQYAFSFSVTVTATATPGILPLSQSISGTENTAITATTTMVTRNFTQSPVTFTVVRTSDSGALPAGLQIDPTTGVISGTPTATATSASYTITATAGTGGSVQTATATVTIEVSAAVQQQQQQNNTPAPEPDRKVTICHRTHATTNPYVRITVDYNSVNKKSGHQGHDEIFADAHVYDSTINYRPKDKKWGDIIPPDPTGLNRWKALNWTTLGQAIYNGTAKGCPDYDAKAYYNALREAGIPEKKIKAEMAELENEQAEARPSIQKTNTKELKYSGNDPKKLEEDNDKVTICHRTNSVTNPYRRITVSTSSVTNKAGHPSHDEIYLTHHVFDSSVNYPANKKDWGDIIPADPTGKNRWQPLNWTALGEAIYNGTVAGCAEKTTQEIYNELRESGLSKKQIKKDLEEQGNLDDDPKDVDDIKYTGEDPDVKKNEPSEPTPPAGKNAPDQSLSGMVWLDLNKDGLKDPNEPYLPKAKVKIYRVTGGAVDPASELLIETDIDGYFEKSSLEPGDYQVVVEIPTEYQVTYDSQGRHEGNVLTTLLPAGKAFTWVGLVGTTEAASDKLLEEVLRLNPASVPIAEQPQWFLAKVAREVKAVADAKLKAQAKAAAAAKAKQAKLAETGSSEPLWIAFGLLVAGAGLLIRRIRPTK